MRVALSLVAIAVILAGCASGGDEGGGGESRVTALALQQLPHDLTSQAMLDSQQLVRDEADVIVQHLEHGVPWDAALANDYNQYPADFKGDIASRKAATPAGRRVLLSTAPISEDRTTIALSRVQPAMAGDPDLVALAPWNTRPLDHADVVTAFTNHCKFLVSEFNPTWLTFCIEANLFRENNGDTAWNQLVNGLGAIRANLRAAYPDLPLIVSISGDAYYRNTPYAQGPAVAQVLGLSDYVSLSTYAAGDTALFPTGAQLNPALIPATYYSDVAALAPAKPFAIAETAWPAEDIDFSGTVVFYSNAAYQQAYVQRLLDECRKLKAKFLYWVVPRDYDDAWNNGWSTSPLANFIRIYRDCGLFDGAGNPRGSADLWRSFRSVPLK